MSIFDRLFCRHKNQEFIRNIYGDEIQEYGWKRSIWRCTGCGKRTAKAELYDDTGAPAND